MAIKKTEAFTNIFYFQTGSLQQKASFLPVMLSLLHG